MAKRILVALGGNAIKLANQKGTTEEQLQNCARTCKQLAEIIKKMARDDRLVITHGNGPQVGNLIVQQDQAKDVVPNQTLDVIGAMTQGQIGYMLQQTLTNCLRNERIDIPVCAVINRVLVDKNDPEFLGESPSKPVGNFLTKGEAMRIRRQHPEYVIKKVRSTTKKCWRRCVPSPDPLLNVESGVIKKMVDLGFIVIASGGGGIPVVLDSYGYYNGVEGVVDKDMAGEKLAEAVNADILLILTDVQKVRLNFGKADEREIEKLTLLEAKKYFEEGHFPPGSMGPKVNACIRFIQWGGKKAIITSLDKAIDALEGKTGTIICQS